jgi:hypothetical protein
MRNRHAQMMIVAVGLWLAVTTVSGQAPYRAPRTADGRPNLNGIWQAINTAHWDIEAHSAAPGVLNAQLGAAYSIPGGMGVVEGGELPYRPEALKKRAENFANRLKLDPEIKCYLPGVPRAMYMPYPFQIAQNPKHIMMFFEFAGAVRTVYMDKADQIEAPADSWMGWSHGRWDGDTLVIDTRGYLDTTWFDRAGNHHSDALHTIERITPRSADTLMYEVTVEDPNVFTRPWKMSMPLYRRVERNAELVEFRCIEFAEEAVYGHLRKPGTK